MSKVISDMDAIGKEGYKVMVNEELKITFVVGHDPRGVLSTPRYPTPRYPIRGHQLA